MRENIGSVKCPFHRRPPTSDVRRDKNGNLYYFCQSCGPVHPHGTGFTMWILENAHINGAEEKTA